MIEKFFSYVHVVFERSRYIAKYKNDSSLQSKITTQFLISFSFLALTFVNLFSRSYIMLVLTVFGCISNLIFAVISKKRKNGLMCAISSIASCSVLFGAFVINGGNDGFACLWIILLPLFAMVTMDIIIGLFTGLFFQAFLIVVFWTPVREKLLFSYNEEFCKRFPLLFLIAFILGLFLALSLQKSEYNECKNSVMLKEMTANARILARTDPLTLLPNRRFAYEEFDAKYVAEGVPHCIVMGDIDSFKVLNDSYGHEFGDDVLVEVAKCMNECLPQDYLKSRWGGEEFLFAANAPIDEVFQNIESLRKAIASLVFNYNGSNVQITITFGIAEYFCKNELAKAISVADKRLYNGKMKSRNCTVADE